MIFYFEIGQVFDQGTQKACLYFKIIICKCVKWVYSSNKFNFDFIKFRLNFLYLQSIKQKSFIMIEELWIDYFFEKINFVLTKQFHPRKSLEISNNVILIPFLDMTYI
jgi:hypothetical protein